MAGPTTDQICEQLRAFIFARLEFEDLQPEAVTFDLDLFETKTIDSVDALEVIIGFEEEYDFQLPESVEDLRDFMSLRSMAKFLQQEMTPDQLAKAFSGDDG